MAAAGPGLALTIGFFDGVHRGHQVLLRRVREAAAVRGLTPAAATFDLHSLEVLHGQGPLHCVMTTEEKVAALRAEGMAEVEVFHFTPEFAAQSGEAFVDRHLVGRLGARHLVVGQDFRFGHRRSCGAEDMVRLAARHDVSVDLVALVDEQGLKISSRDIRARLAEGDVAGAAELLGRPYRLSGPVVEGRRLGRTIGVPTANVAVDPRKILPAHGVYAVTCEVEGNAWGAVLNIGVRPTVSGEGVTVEAHLLDFAGDLYGRAMTIDFLARLRNEQRFDGLDALKAQIAADIDAARGLFRTRRSTDETD